MNEYDFKKKLGEGTFGAVHHVKRKRDNEDLVIKIFTAALTPESYAMFRNEVEVLSKLHHRNVVGYVDHFIDSENHPCIVMPYYGGGTLRDEISAREKPMSRRAINLFRQLCLAVRYIHGKRPESVTHRDIKPENILFAKKKTHLILADFGSSTIMESDRTYILTRAGTPYYMAPEILANEKYTNKCDIWSMGCVLYEMVTLEPAFPVDDFNNMADSYKEVPTSVRPLIRTLITKLLTVDATHRPSAANILKRYVMQ